MQTWGFDSEINQARRRSRRASRIIDWTLVTAALIPVVWFACQLTSRLF